MSESDLPDTERRDTARRDTARRYTTQSSRRGTIIENTSCWGWRRKITVTILTYCIFLVNRTVRKVYPYTKDLLQENWVGSPRTNETSSCADYASYGGCPLQPPSVSKLLWTDRDVFKSPGRAEVFLGNLDAEFMLIYAFGTYLSGWLGDRSDQRYVIAAGALLQAVAMLLFGVLTEYTHWYNRVWYGFTFALISIGQSTSWPNLVDVMNNWYGRQNRGLVLGLWSSCQSVGNVVGSLVATSVVEYGYDVAYTVSAALSASCALVVVLGLVSKPGSIPGEPVPITKAQPKLQPVTQQDDDDRLRTATVETTRGVTLFKAVMLPGVISYCVSVACVKFVNQACFSWLPYYLVDAKDYGDRDSDKYSTMYDIGGAVGTIIGGVVSDQLGKRSPIVVAMLLLSVPPLIIFMRWTVFNLMRYAFGPIGAGVWPNVILMTLIGFFISGCYTLCVSTVTADLGSQKSLADDEAAMATVTGLVDGTASFGAAIGLLTIGPLENRFGWQAVFITFMAMNVIGALSLSKILYLDIRWLVRRCRSGSTVSEAVVPADDCDRLEEAHHQNTITNPVSLERNGTATTANGHGPHLSNGTNDVTLRF